MHPITLSIWQKRSAIAVPSIGSNLMHRRCFPPSSARSSNCSTLNRVEPHASLSSFDQAARNRAIAVPSIGSNLMHRNWQPPTRHSSTYCSTLNRVEPHASLTHLALSHGCWTLQYPQSGRTSCIAKVPRGLMILQSIAVPSIGSNLMHQAEVQKQPMVSVVLQYPQSGRTSCIADTLQGGQRFCLLQYPQSGRTSCIFLLLLYHPLPCLLQYPQSGRTSCILAPLAYYSLADAVLQYPQSGRTSCILDPTGVPIINLGLQYPQSGRTSCISCCATRCSC